MTSYSLTEDSFQTSLLELCQNEIFSLLQQHPAGFKEYDLLLKLQKREIFPFSLFEYSDSLQMFQAHFLLFHLLYRFREKLVQAEEYDLNIHCLDIRLIRKSKENQIPVEYDGVVSYYLNPKHGLDTDRSDVDNMVRDFWKLYTKVDKKEEALTLLEIQEPFTIDKVKKRFRELARIHHPDRGGDPRMFCKIVEAVDLLLKQ